MGIFSDLKKSNFQTEQGFFSLQTGRISSLLLKNEACPVSNRDENGLGLIHWAADRGVVEIVRLLAETCPSLEVNLQDADGQTALHYACSNGHREVAEFLLGVEGVDTTIRDDDGVSAVETIDEDAELRQLFHSKTE